MFLYMAFSVYKISFVFHSYNQEWNHWVISAHMFNFTDSAKRVSKVSYQFAIPLAMYESFS